MRRFLPSSFMLLLSGTYMLAASTLFDTESAPGGPMPAAAAAEIALPPGFRATVFAAEPDVRQPIAMATDARGRLWVAENYTYSERAIGWHPELRDRIVIFEDTDNDGRHDKRTVFWDGARRLTSLEIGHGGVWAICLPELVFIPDRDGDDVPDSAPEVHVDGFEYVRARHTVANGLRWGPDGWLYGRQGILANSHIGKPGTPDADRIPLNTGIWRYHPQRHLFERFAEGTTNPWGMDWDAHGELFFINTVIGHLWHAMPGAHFRRMSGDDPNPRVYEIIEQHADHVHWATGEVWTDVRKGVTGATLAAGGGHAHTGLLIYQGGRWPAEWAGKLLTVNFHGRRLNVERLERAGSAFVGRREPDAFMFPDPRFRGLDLLAAPDGGVFVSDWNDDGECHDNDGIHRSSGRIFKLGYGSPVPAPGNLAVLGAAALVSLQRSPNDWLARTARRVLVDRAAVGRDATETLAELALFEAGATDPIHRLRALWTRHALGASEPVRLQALLDDSDEHIRAWAVRLLVDDRAAPPSAAAVAAFARLAARDPAPRVRLALASALQRLPAAAAAAVAAPLVARAEDADDHNLPLMLWYGLIPLADAPDIAFEALLAGARIPRVQRLGARRLAEEIDTAPQRVDVLLAGIAAAPAAARLAVLDGLAQGFSGRRRAPKPAGWDALQDTLTADATDALRRRLRDLGAFFGDGRALDEVRAVALDTTADPSLRRGALEVLVEARAPALRETATALLRVRSLTAPAAAGLALFDDPAIADLLLAEWPDTYGLERPGVMNVLVSRPAWAAKVLGAVAAGTLARTDLSAAQVRQIRAYHDPALSRRLDELWGPVRDDTETQRAAELQGWSARFTPEKLAGADRANGRVVFRNLCSACHVLNGEGGVLGPDLTGAARDNLGYLLENILFPDAVVPDAYRLTTLTLKDGRTLAGMVRSRATHTLKLQTMTDLVSLSAADIAKEETSPTSLMPPGLLDGLPAAEARDLIAYLLQK